MLLMTQFYGASNSDQIKKEFQLKDVMSTLLESEMKSLVEEEGRFLIQPSLSMSFYDEFLDRRTLSYLAQEKLTKGSISLDSWAQVALASRSEQSFEMMSMFMESVNSGVGSVVSSFGDSGGQSKYEVLRFYGGLPKSVKLDALRGPVKVPLASLLPASQQVIMQALFRRLAPLYQAGMEPDEEGEVFGVIREVNSDYDQSDILREKYGDRVNEPTYALALPEAQPVVLQIDMSSPMRMMALSTQGYAIGGSILNIAEQVVMKESALASGQTDEYYQPYSGFSMVKTLRLEIKIFCGDSFTSKLSCELVDDKATQFGEMSKLPEGVLKEFEAAIKQARKRYEGIEYGVGGGDKQVIPPAVN